jgi:hypothetical protein
MKVYIKTYLIAVIIVIINGCNPKLIPLKGKYADSPFEITSIKSVDSIWVDITQLFNQNGLSIKKLEKEKGVIVSTKTSFIPAYTFEDKDGKLIQPEAWIVLEEVYLKKKKWYPNKIYCQWDIQITEKGKELSTIKVAPIVMCTYYPNMFTTMEIHCQSTGKLEELINSLQNK